MKRYFLRFPMDTDLLYVACTYAVRSQKRPKRCSWLWRWTWKTMLKASTPRLGVGFPLKEGLGLFLRFWLCCCSHWTRPRVKGSKEASSSLSNFLDTKEVSEKPFLCMSSKKEGRALKSSGETSYGETIYPTAEFVNCQQKAEFFPS